MELNSMENFHEKNPSNVYEKFHGIPWKIPWKFMKLRLNSRNSMEFGFDREGQIP
jgi:hypothetical protein